MTLYSDGFYIGGFGHKVYRVFTDTHDNMKEALSCWAIERGFHHGGFELTHDYRESHDFTNEDITAGAPVIFTDPNLEMLFKLSVQPITLGS